MKKIMISIVVLLVLISCDKISKNEMGTNIKLPQNTQILNPYDSVGIIHNDFISFCYDNLDHSMELCNPLVVDGDTVTKKIFLDTLISLVEPFLLMKGYNTNIADSISLMINNLFANSNLFDEFSGHKYIKDYQCNTLNLMETAVELGYMDESTYNENYTFFEAFQNAEYNKADSILNDKLNNISNINDVGTLYMLSVFEHSKIFWGNYYPSSIIFKKIASKQVSAEESARNIVVAMWDGLGASAGQSAGPIGASMIASIFSSTATAMMEIMDSLFGGGCDNGVTSPEAPSVPYYCPCCGRRLK